MQLANNGKALAMAGHLKIVCPNRSRIKLLMMKIRTKAKLLTSSWN